MPGQPRPSAATSSFLLLLFLLFLRPEEPQPGSPALGVSTARQVVPGRGECCSGTWPQCCGALAWGFSLEESLTLRGSTALAFSLSHEDFNALV